VLRDIDLPTLRAALWTRRALRQTRRGLRKAGVAGVVVSSPPPLPESARRGVLAILRRSPSTCLERAFVLQRWHASHGIKREVVIGVSGTGQHFKAHAWLDGASDSHDGSFRELLRLPAG
jgi:Transglutaminase-like superfamily